MTSVRVNFCIAIVAHALGRRQPPKLTYAAQPLQLFEISFTNKLDCCLALSSEVAVNPQLHRTRPRLRVEVCSSERGARWRWFATEETENHPTWGLIRRQSASNPSVSRAPASDAGATHRYTDPYTFSEISHGLAVAV